MRVLVTGGAGYIGSHTCVELLNKGYDIIIIDNLENSNIKAIDRIKFITKKDFPFINADVRDKEKLDNIFKQYKPEAVIHFAGLKAVGESVKKPLMYYDNNLLSTISLLEVMQHNNVKKIVFSSSATVYGLTDKVPMNEELPTGAINPYGQTKVFIEHILRDIYNSDNDWSIALLRYFNPLGAHESGLIGEDPNGIPNNLLPYIAQVAVGRLEKLTVFGNDYKTIDGTGVRDYIHVVDLAKGHIKALEYLAENKGCEAFNLGRGEGYSVLQVIEAFESASNKKIPYVIGPRRPGDPDTVYANVGKAHDILKWQAEKNIFDMCKDTWNWQKNNPMGYNS